MSYILYINQKELIAELPLPAVSNRQITLDISDICGCSLLLEEYEGEWRIIGTDEVNVISDTPIISDGAVIRLEHGSGRFAVMAKEMHAEKNTFAKYQLGERTSVGRAEDNDIIIKDEFTGSHHCVITASDGGYVLSDSSKNGTYINGKRVVGENKLNIFDTIYVTGHKLIFLGNIIAVCENDCVETKLKKADIASLVNTEAVEDSSYFSRAPRRIRPLDTETVEIDDPPAKQKLREQPLIFIIGPSVTMPIPILVSVLVNIVSTSGSGRSGIMYLGTALSVILSALIGTCWALAHQIYNKKMLTSDEKERVEAYSKYIENNRQLLEDKQKKNREIIEESYLSSEELYFAAEKKILWNRNIFQSDFLTIRLGRGKVKSPAETAVSKQRFSMNDDELAGYPHELQESFELIDGCVSRMSFLSHKIIGIAGDSEKLPLIVNNIICQIAALHCYSDVKIAFLGTDTDRKRYSWVKWLPHAFMNGGECRLLGFDSESRESTLYRTAAELRKRSVSAEENKDKAILPHIVLFCTSPELIRNSVLCRFMESPAYLGITFILVYGEISRLPNSCGAVIECSEDFSGSYLLDGEITEENKIDFDLVSADDAEKLVRKISGFYVDEASGGAIPSAVDYYDMIGIGKPEHWDLLRHYRSSRSYEGIRSFIGLGAGGEPVILDIHDKKDGPHGLVAGTTGSGKSETLQTFILSIVMNYSPADAAFVLIDYKGGGMANMFEGLPHIAGMVTNLSDEENGGIDRSLTRRACSSLRSEIKRRQSVFKKYGINHIDAYSRLYGGGKASEPMPHLIIISDEFAELKKEQPDFIRELVSISRVGRSLGIHLILATQKPSGVVDDEIQSNSRFRICLRVQDKQDSAGMIMRPDAAFLTESGRAFLLIGSDERFEEFQSGYSGGEYVPHDTVVSAEDSEAVMIAIDGSPAAVHIKGKTDINAVSELEAAVEYIRTQSEILHIPSAAQLWNPPLGREIFLDDIDDTVSEGITAAYGLSDDLERQSQDICRINLADCSNLKICGTAGSGKTTLLQTIIVSAVKKYSPSEFNFYVLDFSSRTFKLFRDLPHCGGAVYEDESDAVKRLITLVSDKISERKKLFERENIGSYREYSKLHKLPLIAVFIDNYKGFSYAYEQYEEILERIMHECVRYGIQFVITAGNQSEIKYKMRSSLVDSICLRMTEKGDYTEFLGRNVDFLPNAVSGRGLTVSGGSVIEFQTFLSVKGSSEAERSAVLKVLFAKLSNKYGDSERAEAIPIIPADASYSSLLDEVGSSDRLPIGYELETAQPYSCLLSEFYCMCISGCDFSDLGRPFGNLISYAEKYNVILKAVRVNKAVNFDIPEIVEVFETADDIRRLTEYLLGEFSKRNAAVPDYKKDSGGIERDSFMAEKFGRVFVIIDDMAEFCDIVHNTCDKRTVCDLLEDFIKNGKDHGVHFFGGYSSQKKTYLGLSDAFKSENHGMHLGGKVNEQNALRIDIPLPEKIKTTQADNGWSIMDGRINSIFVPGKQ